MDENRQAPRTGFVARPLNGVPGMQTVQAPIGAAFMPITDAPSFTTIFEGILLPITALADLSLSDETYTFELVRSNEAIEKADQFHYLGYWRALDLHVLFRGPFFLKGVQ